MKREEIIKAVADWMEIMEDNSDYPIEKEEKLQATIYTYENFVNGEVSDYIEMLFDFVEIEDNETFRANYLDLARRLIKMKS